MAFPYSSGDVLTAADLNASSGLVLIKSQTVGAGVSSVTVTGAFSSTFVNYRIVVDGIDCSVGAGNQLQFGLGSTTLSMYGSFYYDKFDGTSTGTGRFSGTTTMSCAMQAVNSNTGCVMDIQRPYENTRTNWSGQYNGEGWSGWYGGTNTVTSAQTSFYLSSAGTMTGGTIRVYGYNNG
jgi:hypothetical protein